MPRWCTTNNDLEKADSLNAFFASVFTKENTDQIPQTAGIGVEELLENIKFTEQDIQ